MQQDTITLKRMAIKAAHLTRQPCKNVSKLIRRSLITLKNVKLYFSAWKIIISLFLICKYIIREPWGQKFENWQIKSVKYTVVVLRAHQKWVYELRLLAARRHTKNNMHGKEVWFLFCVFICSLKRQFEQTGISINAKDQTTSRKVC